MRRTGETFQCSGCGSPVYRSAADQRKTKGNEYYCSRACRSLERNQKMYARSSAWKALQRGLLVKPPTCNRCNDAVDLQAHHHDYSKPLDVEWICRPCHGVEHADDRRRLVESRSLYRDTSCACGRPARARGMCLPCYDTWYQSRPDKRTCVVPGCAVGERTRGLCARHYQHASCVSLRLPARRPGPKAC